MTPERFLSANPHFCKSALSRYTQRDFIALVERHRIRYHEKTLGQLFCDGSAREILAMLLAECAAARVDLRAGHSVSEISRADRFRVETNRGSFVAPAAGAGDRRALDSEDGRDGIRIRCSAAFGLAVSSRGRDWCRLKVAGETLDCAGRCPACRSMRSVSVGRDNFRENILFTHRGLSGPAILQISSYWRDGDTLSIDLAPALDVEASLRTESATRPKAELKTVLAEVLPARLAHALAGAAYRNVTIANVPDRDLTELAHRLKRWQLKPTGSEGLAKAEVTVGGVDTAALSSKTMEAREVPGLFVIGEAVDVTGWLGGYNFQWAWSSGWCAGNAV